MGGLVGGFLSTGVVHLGNKPRWYLNRFLYMLLIAVLACSGLAYGFNSKESKIVLKVNELQQYDKEQKWSDAERIGEEILALEPVDKTVKSQVLWSIARAEGISGKYNEGVEHGKMLKQIDPPDGNYLLGLLYFDMKQYNSAIEALQEAKRLNASYKNIDDLLKELNKIEEGK
jgi:rhomboid protease GluP